MDYQEKSRIEREWLAAAKAGDSVYRISYGRWHAAEKLEIERVTKTQLILKNGMRLKRSDCREVSAPAYGRTFYLPAVEHNAAEIESAKTARSDKDAADKLLARIELIHKNGHMTARVTAELNATLERLGLAAPVAS